MFDMAVQQWGGHSVLRGKIRKLHDELEKGLEGVSLRTVQQRVGRISTLMRQFMSKRELSGPVYEELIHLKSMHARYQNYAQWLKQEGAS